MKYPVLDDIPALRDEKETRLIMEESVKDEYEVTQGILRPSALLALNHFNIISGLIVEYMH